LKLASYFEDRPVYAIRARGFEEGEAPFDSLDDVLATYLAKIKQYQPTGPYAIVGYSFGSMIAFELAKLLLPKDEVKLLGVLNLPPHIKFRMRQLDWTNCVLQLSYFLKLFSEEYAHSQYAQLCQLPRQEALQRILNAGAVGRLVELGLDGPKLANWADVAYRLQASAVDYEPSGMVDNIDIFCAIPLTEVADNLEDWKTNHLSKWVEFSRTAPQFHDVDGSHYTMLDQGNVYSFQKRLKVVLQNRGI
jgi:thioesterase domain-containing protein